jgi:hypothetical protein
MTVAAHAQWFLSTAPVAVTAAAKEEKHDDNDY